jgi:hypothetical protein
VKRKSRFSIERSVYWPAEFSDIVNILTGRLADGTPSQGGSLYNYNTGAIVFAAAVGLSYGRERDVGPDRKEITTATFTSQELDAYIFLIALLAKKSFDADLLRQSGEEVVIRTFERFTAGGLEILRGVFDESPTQSAEVVIQRFLIRQSGPTAPSGGINLTF